MKEKTNDMMMTGYRIGGLDRDHLGRTGDIIVQIWTNSDRNFKKIFNAIVIVMRFQFQFETDSARDNDVQWNSIGCVFVRHPGASSFTIPIKKCIHKNSCKSYNLVMDKTRKQNPALFGNAWISNGCMTGSKYRINKIIFT